MITTLKDYLDDFLVLPGMVKAIIYAVILALIAVCLWQSVSNYLGNKKIERIEAENKIPAEKATRFEANAQIFAAQATEEKVRADNLQSQIPKIEEKIKNTNEKINSQSKTSDNLRGDLQRVRKSKPVRADEAEINRKAAKRYGQSNDAR